ncbi:unnamed protein product [Cuscuta campestris]|uniref:Uncharacterized protein n=1 Tax=Cuscuta campestris TaxID=132261 RepID=A0A484MX24_9ASTE|nr:unnamed protein product [Cuscuta campestris]
MDCGNLAFVKVAFPLKPSFLWEPRRFLQSFIPPPDRMEICSSATEDLAHPGTGAFPARYLNKFAVVEGGHAHPGTGGVHGVVCGREGQGRRGASEAAGQARIAAEEKARRLDEEAEHVIKAFQTSLAFEEAALSRMNNLLKVWAQTPNGQRLLLKEGQANYSMGLHRAQEVLLEWIRDGKELPKPCENPEEFDSSIYYSDDEDTAGGGEDTAGN